MKLKGDLSNITLANIFELIISYGTEGTLVVYDDKSRKEIFFGREGVRLLATGARKGQLLGELLIKRKIITPEQLNQALTLQKTSMRKMGEIMCDLGLLTQERLNDFVRNQIVDEICDIFRWNNAQYKFMDGPPTSDSALYSGGVPISNLILNVKPLLETIRQKHRDWQNIKALFTSPNVIFKLDKESKQKAVEFQLQADESLTLDLVNGIKTLDQIIHESSIGVSETYQALYNLYQKGIISSDQDDTAKKADKPLVDTKKLEQELTVTREALKNNPTDITLQETVAKLMEELNWLAGAGEEYKKLGKLLADANEGDRAIAALKKALSLLHLDEDTYILLFTLLLKKGQTQEAIAVGKELIDIYSYSKDIKEVQNWIDTITELAKSAGDNKLDLEMQAYLASAYFQMCEYDKFDAEVRHAIKEQPLDKINGLIKTCERELDSAPSFSGIRYRLNFLRQIKSLRHSQSKRWIIVSAVAAVILIGAGLFALNDYQAYKTFLSAKKDADELISKKDYDGALNKYAALKYDLTLYSKPKIEAEIARVSQLQAIQGPSPSTHVTVKDDISKLQGLMDDAVTLKDDNNYDKARTALQDLDSQVKQQINNLPNQIKTLGGDETQIRSLTQKYQAFRTKLIKELEPVEAYLNEATALSNRAQELDNDGQLEKVAAIVNKLITKYPGADVAKSAKVPVRIESMPADADVSMDDKKCGKTPMKVYLSYKEPVTLTVSKPGYGSIAKKIKAYEQAVVSIQLPKAAKWIFTSQLPVDTTPLLGDELIYLTMKDGYLKAINTKDGVQQWVFRTDNPAEIYSSPKLNRGTILFGATDTYLYAVRANAPVKSYQVKTGGAIMASPFCSPDSKIVLIGSDDKNIYAFAEDKLLWKYNANARINDTGIVYKETAYFTADDGVLHAVDMKTGEKKYNLALNGELTPPVIKNNFLFVGSSNNTIYAIEIANNNPDKPDDISLGIRWTVKLPRGIKAPLTMANDDLLVPCQDNTLYSINTPTQKTNWKVETNGALDGGVAVSLKNNEVCFGSEDTYFYAVDLQTGQEIWHYKTNSKIRSMPVMDDKTVYFSGDDGKFYALEK